MNKELSNNKTLAEISAELRKKFTGSDYSVDELRRIYVHTNISDYFFMDNSSNCDVGSVKKHSICNIKRIHLACNSQTN